MALAIKYEHLLGNGRVPDQPALAILAGVDQSQVSAILRLRQLAPDIQEWLLSLPEQEENGDPICMYDLRKLPGIISWEEQREELNRIIPMNAWQST